MVPKKYENLYRIVEGYSMEEEEVVHEGPSP